MNLRRKIAGLAITAGLAAGALGVGASPASAHSFGAQGPPHTHYTCNRGSNGDDNCYRWILANGAIIQGSFTLLKQQWGYVGVICSYGETGSFDDPWNEGWQVNNERVGIWGSNGFHTYCQNPKYPVNGGGFLAGWSLNS